MDLKDTKLIGHYKHVIRLNYPCGNIEDIKDNYGEPPTVEILVVALKRHREDCEDCS